ncbi:MAG TPA: hypothetical protein VEX43_02030 [Chthoniobacterales bacterium]|nr:hypothetical protein [Chthoniobacterales bacterium]
MKFASEFRQWSIQKQTRFVFGVTLLTSIPILLVPLYFKQSGALARLGQEKEGALVHNANKQLFTGGPLMFRVGWLKLRYPRIMKTNETAFVELDYAMAGVTIDFPHRDDQHSGSEPERQLYNTLEGSISVSVESSAFEIAPRSEVSKGPGSPLPVEATWTVTPKGEGHHYLLVNIRQDLGADLAMLQERLTQVEVKINGETVPKDQRGVYRLPVTVVTIYGVSQRAIGVAGLAAGLIGFLVTWDILLPFLRRLFRIKTTRSRTARRNPDPRQRKRHHRARIRSEL